MNERIDDTSLRELGSFSTGSENSAPVVSNPNRSDSFATSVAHSSSRDVYASHDDSRIGTEAVPDQSNSSQFVQNQAGTLQTGTTAAVDNSSHTGTSSGSDSLDIEKRKEVNLEQLNSSLLTNDSRIITARGTEDGLILRIDGKAEWADILQDIEHFLGGRRKFFEGGEVSIEWLDRLPTVQQGKELEELLRGRYGIEIVVRKKRPSLSSVAKENSKQLKDTQSKDLNDPTLARDSSGKKLGKKSGVTINLFDEVPKEEFTSLTDRLEIRNESPLSAGATGRANNKREQQREQHSTRGSMNSDDELQVFSSGKLGSRMSKMLGDDLFYEDDANAKVIFGTLRSGQRIETPFSLIVIGDVNPGADLIAGGDIIIFGGLRGTAHASAYDDDALDRVIIALQMQPMQLRIGSVISRGSDELVRGAEIARIENRRIIVEAFNPRALVGRKLR